MNLEINNKHKKIDLSKLKDRNKVSSSIMSAVLAISLFSGCSKQVNNLNNNVPSTNEATIEEVIDTPTVKDTPIKKVFKYDKNEDKEVLSKIDSVLKNDIVEFPESLKNSINLSKDDIVTKEYLESLTELNISTVSISNKEDLIWLNYCTNLNTLKLLVFDDDILEYVSTLPNLERLALYNCGKGSATIDSDNSKILFSPKLNYLVLSDFNVEPGFIESLKNLKILDFSYTNNTILINYDLDYSKLTHLDRLIVSNPYSVAVRMDSKELNGLLEKNILITTRQNEDMSYQLLTINKELDDIVNSIEIKENASEEEKLDAIIMYVLNHLNYDPELNAKLENNESYNASSFYDDGCLYGALELDTQICGNYSALVSALCERLDINDINQMSTVHSWNLVYVDGNNYYLDTTIIDSKVTDENNLDEVKESEWYLKDPNLEVDYVHTANNLSDLIKIEEIPSLEAHSFEAFEQAIREKDWAKEKDISEKQYKITINKNTYIVSAGVLVGILGGLGYAYMQKKKSNEEKLNNENEQILRK